jgi:hypothetical protein
LASSARRKHDGVSNPGPVGYTSGHNAGPSLPGALAGTTFSGSFGAETGVLANACGGGCSEAGYAARRHRTVVRRAGGQRQPGQIRGSPDFVAERIINVGRNGDRGYGGFRIYARGVSERQVRAPGQLCQ